MTVSVRSMAELRGLSKLGHVDIVSLLLTRHDGTIEVIDTSQIPTMPSKLSTPGIYGGLAEIYGQAGHEEKRKMLVALGRTEDEADRILDPIEEPTND